MMMHFTDEEIETLKEILNDWGSDMPCTDYDKVRAIGVKLGVWEPKKPLTEEEIKRREEFAKSPYGLMITKLFSQTNEYFNKIAEEIIDTKTFMDGAQWNKQELGSILKINLPKDWNK